MPRQLTQFGQDDPDEEGALSGAEQRSQRGPIVASRELMQTLHTAPGHPVAARRHTPDSGAGKRSRAEPPRNERHGERWTQRRLRMVTRVSGARGDPSPVDAKTMPDRRRPMKRKRPRPKGPRALEMLWVRGSGHQVEGGRFALFLQPWPPFEMLEGRLAVRVAGNRPMPAFTPLAFAEGILRTQVSRFDSVDHGITSLFCCSRHPG